MCVLSTSGAKISFGVGETPLPQVADAVGAQNSEFEVKNDSREKAESTAGELTVKVEYGDKSATKAIRGGKGAASDRYSGA